MKIGVEKEVRFWRHFINISFQNRENIDDFGGFGGWGAEDIIEFVPFEEENGRIINYSNPGLLPYLEENGRKYKNYWERRRQKEEY